MLAGNLQVVRERIARAASRAGRNAAEITLVAVSKTQPAEIIRAAHQAGVRHFGENRVQEWISKQPALADLDAIWHLIGHLQSNKARRAASLFQSIDSVDSVALAQKLDAALAAEGGKNSRLPVFLEVRVSVEESKTGVAQEGLAALVEGILNLPRLELRGLMCIPPFFDDAERTRPFFRGLRVTRDALRLKLNAHPGVETGQPLLPELSMGMSHDFEIAIEEGATQVRIGSAVFGARPG